VTHEPVSDPPRAAWWEVLGAWLHIWTPPRGVVVPPVPWRWVAVAGVALGALVAVVLLVVAPRVDEGKRRGAAEQARQTAEARREQAAVLRRDQRATFVALDRGPVVPQIVAAVRAGVRARVRSGELGARRILSVECGRPERYSRGRTAYVTSSPRGTSRSPRAGRTTRRPPRPSVAWAIEKT